MRPGGGLIVARSPGTRDVHRDLSPGLGPQTAASDFSSHFHCFSVWFLDTGSQSDRTGCKRGRIPVMKTWVSTQHHCQPPHADLSPTWTFQSHTHWGNYYFSSPWFQSSCLCVFLFSKAVHPSSWTIVKPLDETFVSIARKEYKNSKNVTHYFLMDKLPTFRPGNIYVEFWKTSVSAKNSKLRNLKEDY